MAKVIIPTPLRKFAKNQSRLVATGTTVQEVLHALTEQYQDLKVHLLDKTGQIRSFIRIYVGDEDIEALNGYETPVSAISVISIVPAIAGGIG